MKHVVEGVKPRELVRLEPQLRLAGLEPFTAAV